MKYIVLCLFCLISLGAFSQKSYLPGRVAKTFEKKFPGVTDIKWNVEKGDYKIKFIYKGKKTTVEIDPDGTWEKTSTHIAFEELPAPVQQAVNQRKNKAGIDEIKQVVDDEGNSYYRIELIDESNKTKMDFLADGKLIKLDTNPIK